MLPFMLRASNAVRHALPALQHADHATKEWLSTFVGGGGGGSGGKGAADDGLGLEGEPKTEAALGRDAGAGDFRIRAGSSGRLAGSLRSSAGSAGAGAPSKSPSGAGKCLCSSSSSSSSRRTCCLPVV